MRIFTVVITKEASSIPLHASWVVFLITDIHLPEAYSVFLYSYVMHSDSFFTVKIWYFKKSAHRLALNTAHEATWASASLSILFSANFGLHIPVNVWNFQLKGLASILLLLIKVCNFSKR